MAYALSGFYFFYFALVAVHVIFLPKVLNLIGYSFIDLSIIMAASPLIRFLSPFLFVKYIKLNSTVYIFALILTIISTIMVYFVIDSFWLLLIVALFLGFGVSLVLPFVEVIALEYIPHDRYGKVRLFGSIGFIIVSLVLVEYLDDPYNSIHFLVLTASFIAVFGLWVLSFVDHGVKESKPASMEGLSAFFKDKYLWISLFLMQLAFMPFYSFFFIHETAHGLSSQMTIYLWSFGVICEIFMFNFQGPLLEQFTLINLLIFSTFITVLRWLILFMFPENTTLLAISQALHAFSFGLYHSVAIRYLYTLYENKALAQQFFMGIAYGLGGLLGTIASGIWYDQSPETLYLFAAATTLLAWYLMRAHKLKEI
jgi:MFS transporter, PPP family, 3-phenylpropionic acid transporter